MAQPPLAGFPGNPSRPGAPSPLTGDPAADLVTRARWAAGITMQDLARELETSTDHLYRMESGLVRIDARMVLQYHRALGIPLGDLIDAVLGNQPEGDTR